MSFKQHNSKIVNSVLFASLLILLTSCGDSSALESMVRADPKLKESLISSPQISESEKKEAAETPTSETKELNLDNNLDNKAIAGNSKTAETLVVKDNSPKTQPSATTELALPNNFPKDFPLYPHINLKDVKLNDRSRSGMVTWTSPKNIQEIAQYYGSQLTVNGWEMTKPISEDTQSGIVRAIAIKNDLKLHLTILQRRDGKTGKDGSNLSLIYEPAQQNIATSEKNSTIKNPESKNSKESPQNKSNQQTDLPAFVPEKRENNIPQESESILDTSYIPFPGADFEDLDDAPEQLNEPLETVAALGILSPHTRDGNVETSKFAPNATITRGEYARWLIAVNNRYHEGDPGKKIYVANNTSEPAFQDVPAENPDFGAIQGLAEAGLVPSRLTQDSTKLLFRPNAPLTREDLIAWKVPLDTRQALPKASIEALEESWGFQDAANIDSSAIRALYADYQNGDRSNVRRIFGFTTLFQPKKPVTRAEAAASLWYFGFQGDGITAKEILDAETETETESNS